MEFSVIKQINESEIKMRIDIKKTEVYPFDELTDDAKQTALEQLADINVDFEWWEFTYEDAANVGIKITGFDLDRGSYCEGDFILDAEEVANKIIAEHGESCETYKTAKDFLDAAKVIKEKFESDVNYDPEYKEYNESDDYEDAVEEFKQFILEDYRIILQHDYEYLTGEEAIVRTIEANDYEFTADGKIYY
jgi:hypothetical protein